MRLIIELSYRLIFNHYKKLNTESEESKVYYDLLYGMRRWIDFVSKHSKS